MDPYSHILVAERTFKDVATRVSEKFGLDSSDLEKFKSYYYCGSIFPDMGNYSGLNRSISEFSHNLRTWDLVREMMALSKTPEEWFFACGWAGHVVADVMGHPGFTNVVQAEIMGKMEEFPQGIPAQAFPLEHKKTEFGASAFLLGEAKNIFLWDVRLSFPFEEVLSSKKTMVQVAFERIYGLTLDPLDIRSGLKCLRRDIKRIPVVMKLLGSVRFNRWEFLDRGLSLFLRFIVLPVYLLFASKSLSQGALAVLKPFKLEKKHTERLIEVIHRCVAGYLQDLENDFCHMKNLNLDTGVMPQKGLSKHADFLMKELFNSDPEKRFLDLFGNEYGFLYESWKGFEDLYYSQRKPG